VEVQDFLMEDPPRLVIDFLGAQHELDQNKFEGDGSFVTSVRSSQFTTDPEQITRIVFDLKDNVAYKVSNEPHAVTVRFYSKDKPAPAAEAPSTMAGSVAPMGDLSAAVTAKPAPSSETDKPVKTESEKPTAKWQPAPQKTDSPVQAKPVESKTTTQPATAEPVPASSAQPPLESKAKAAPTQQPTTQPMTSWSKPSQAQPKPATSTTSTPQQSLRSFAANAGLVRNKNMTIDVQNAHVRTVLRSMAEFSNVNIISGPEVDGQVTAHLKNVPWRQALDIILRSHGFGWREEYGMIRVSTLDRLTKEELELQAAERQKDDLLPLSTEIMALSYANAGEMKRALKEMLTTRGSIEVERSNNALVVTDIEKVIRKIALMVEELDRKTKQVEIVAKMVDVDFEASREIGVRWDALNLSGSDINAVGDAVIDARATNPAGVFRIGTVQSWGELSFILDALEQEQKANIISNPRIVTADNREATILVGKEIPLIVSDEAGNPITELTKVGIILRVTPHVNQDNSVTLDLHPEVSELSAQATVQGGVIISLSEADTRVVVGHGETAVIGGLINEVESQLERGVPGLMNIPYLGNLFKLKNKTTKKRELIIFVTPKIVDNMASN
jgi:type IV pilus assembly protein PilQ